MTSDAAAFVADAGLVPDTLDLGDRLGFRRYAPQDLRRASFLDGRERLGRPAGTVPFADLAGPVAALAGLPLPTLLHVSFCGSTLLARLLDVPAATIVYREPAIQIALADAAAAGRRDAEHLTTVTRLLGRAVDGAAAIVKPTNWANVLLPDWARAGTIRPVFVTMAPRRFLTAVFRGGRDRIGFTLRAADHFARVVAGGTDLTRAAIAADEAPLARAARLVLVALDLQLTLFADARAALGGEVIDERDIQADPLAAARRAAAGLGFAALAEHLHDPAALATGHAKSPGRPFSSRAEAAANAEIERHHGTTFDAALAWAAGQPLQLVLR